MVVFLGIFVGFFLDGLIRRSLRCIAILSVCRNFSKFSYIRLQRALCSYLLFDRGSLGGGRVLICFFYSFAVGFVCFVNYYFGVDIFSQLILLFLFFLLLLISVLDCKTKLIPDFLSYSVFWLGVFARVSRDGVMLIDGLYAAVFVYVILKILQVIYLIGFRKDALGDADPLLAFCVGVWFDIWQVPYFLLLAVFATLISVVIFTKLKKPLLTMEIPFGPGLAFAGFVLVEFQFLNLTLIGY
jgi:general secretion pathway protein O